MIPNKPPDDQVGVIPGTFGVAGVTVAVAQLHGRDAVVVCFHAGSGWSVQALLDQRCHWLRCRLLPEKVATLPGGTSFFSGVIAKFPANLKFDRVVLYAPQLLLDFDVLSIRFQVVWILSFLR